MKNPLAAYRFEWSHLLLAVFVVGMVHYGSTKGVIRYPATDVTQSYITDAGSFVTNDAVCVRFTFRVAPANAPFFLDAVPLWATNAAAVATAAVTVVETTLGAFGDGAAHWITYANATNYDWYGYTTWTPGSAVTTNGVWHLDAWTAARDGTLGARKENSYVPKRTKIETGKGERR